MVRGGGGVGPETHTDLLLLPPQRGCPDRLSRFLFDSRSFPPPVEKTNSRNRRGVTVLGTLSPGPRWCDGLWGTAWWPRSAIAGLLPNRRRGEGTLSHCKQAGGWVESILVQAVHVRAAMHDKPRELRQYYELLDRLGQGNYGEVYRTRQNETGKIFAAKSINKKSHWSLNEFKRRIAQVRISDFCLHACPPPTNLV